MHINQYFFCGTYFSVLLFWMLCGNVPVLYASEESIVSRLIKENETINPEIPFWRKIYNDKGWLIKEINEEGGIINYEHDTNGNAILKRQLISKDVWAEWSRHFDENNNLIREIGPSGEEARYIRENGLTKHSLKKIDEHLWSVVSYEYNSFSKISKESIGYYISSIDELRDIKDLSCVIYEYDKNGNLLSLTEPCGDKISFSYDAKGRIISEILASGGEFKYLYDESGKILKKRDPFGNGTEWRYDKDGYPVEIIGSASGEMGCMSCGKSAETADLPGTYEWENGLLLGYTDLSSHRTMFIYNDQGQKVKQIDPAGGVTEFIYDINGLVVAIIDPSGKKTSYYYSKTGLLLRKRDALGNEDKYTYNLANQLTAIDYPDGGRVELIRDLSGRIIENRTLVSDDLWRTTGYSFNFRGDVTEVTLANGIVVAYRYNPAGSMTEEVIDQSGLSIMRQFSYDSCGRLVERVDPLGNMTTYEYEHGSLSKIVSPEDRTIGIINDAIGRPIEIKFDPDKLAQTFSIQYDSSGKLRKQSDGLTTKTFDYDETGLLQGMSISGRAPIEYFYDNAGRVTSVSRTDKFSEYVIKGEYDPAGRLLKMTDELGYDTLYQYNDIGLLNKILEPSNSVTEIKYDPMGRILEVIYPEHIRITYQYNLTGEIIAVDGGPDGSKRYFYDSLGRVIEILSANGLSQKISYDSVGRIEKSENNAGDVVSFEYDLSGRRTLMRDENGNATRYQYDKDGLVVSQTYPSVDAKKADMEKYSYDAALRLIQKITPNGEIINFRHDIAGNISAVYTGMKLLENQEIPNENLLVAYKRDESGKVISEKDPFTTMNYAFDSFGRLRTVSDTAIGKDVLYEYDARDKRIEMRLMAGDALNKDGVLSIIRYTYDPSGRLIRLQKDNESFVDYIYDKAGRRSSIHYPNNTITTYQYDNRSRLEKLETLLLGGTSIKKFIYEYDSIGNRIGIHYGDGAHSDYAYDAMSRLTLDRRSDSSGELLYEEIFSYDKVGNRLMKNSSISGTNKYIYNTRNQLTEIHRKNFIEKFEYDQNGNLVESWSPGARESYKYDALNRLIETQNSKGTETTNFRGVYWSRLRTSTSTDTGHDDSIFYVYDVDNVFADFRLEDTEYSLSRSYLMPFLDEPLSFSEHDEHMAKTTYYYSHDALKSVRTLTDANGFAIADYDYLAFGEKWNVSGKANKVTQRYGFSGRENSSLSDTMFYRMRQYAPNVGRMLNPSPWGVIQSRYSLYDYAKVNPVRFNEPFSTAMDTVDGAFYDTPSGYPYTDVGMPEGMLKNMHGLSDALSKIKEMRDSGEPDWKEKGFWMLFELDEIYQTNSRHIFRNIFNVCPENPPQRNTVQNCYQDRLGNVWMYEKPNGIFHRGLTCYRGTGEYQGSQCCYNSTTGALDDKSKEMGTYDFSAPEFDDFGNVKIERGNFQKSVSHIFIDIFPHSLDNGYIQGLTKIY